MSAKPILFSGPMVRAILAGTKTQTRRPMKPPPRQGRRRDGSPIALPVDALGAPYSVWPHPKHGTIPLTKDCLYRLAEAAPYPAGTRLWAREGWANATPPDPSLPVQYRADWPEHEYGPRWHPSIHMPRWASRITLEVTAVRVERVRDISEADARAEGFTATEKYTAQRAFRWAWEEMYGRKDGLRWSQNPWVWVYEFRRVEP